MPQAQKGEERSGLGPPLRGSWYKNPLAFRCAWQPDSGHPDWGEQADCFQALLLLKGMTTSAVLAAKGYDAGYIADEASAMGAETVIPPVRHRRTLGNMTSFCITSAMLLKKHLGK